MMSQLTSPSRFPRLGPYPGAMSPAALTQLIDTHHPAATPGDALQILVTILHHAGYLDEALLRGISAHSQVPVADLRSLCSFYSFLDQPTPCRYRILISTNIVDEYQGAQDALALLQNHFRDQTDIIIKPTACTGFSDLTPGALINGVAITRVTPQRAADIARLIDDGIPFAQWPADFFDYQSAIHQRDLLLNLYFAPGDAFQAALRQSPREFIETLKISGLRGRGGAGFPTWLKWNTAADTVAEQKYVVCNADEGEPGTFKDRVLLEHHTQAVIEGMRLCGWAIGATRGVIYLRGEYLWMYDALQACLTANRATGLLSADSFDIGIHVGAGAYVCGEESALLESMEGKRGIPRIRPPFPAQQGYRGKPTVVNNVETFCAVSWIALNGGEAFAQRGNASSSGTKLHSVSGDCARPGIYELPMGATVKSLLDACGATDTLAVQVGGPSGRLLFADQFDTAIDFAHVSSGGSYMVFSRSRNLLGLLRNFARFFAHESCGFCTPCRAGTQVIVRTLDQIAHQQTPPQAERDLTELAHLLHTTSHCGLGQTAANALIDFMQHCPEQFAALTRRQASGTKVFLREESR